MRLIIALLSAVGCSTNQTEITTDGAYLVFWECVENCAGEPILELGKPSLVTLQGATALLGKFPDEPDTFGIVSFTPVDPVADGPLDNPTGPTGYWIGDACLAEYPSGGCRVTMQRLHIVFDEDGWHTEDLMRGADQIPGAALAIDEPPWDVIYHVTAVRQ